MFEERNQTGGDADHLVRRNVDIIDHFRNDLFVVAAVARDDETGDRVRNEASERVFGGAFDFSVGRDEAFFVFFVSAEPVDLIGNDSVDHATIRRNQEAEFVDARVERQGRNQTDVGAFRRLDRADTTVVRGVNVADFETGAFAVQTARAERGETAFVRQHRQRVRLVDDLRQFAATKEVVDRRRNVFRVDDGARRFFVAETVLRGATQLQEAFANFFAGEFVDRAKTTVPQVVDVVRFGFGVAAPKFVKVLDRFDEVFGAQHRFVEVDVHTEFAVHSETTDATQAIAGRIEELIAYEIARFVQQGRVARTQTLEDREQRVFVRIRLVFFKRVEEELVALVVHRFDLRQTGGADFFRFTLRDLLARLDDDFVRVSGIGGIFNIADRDFPFDFGDRFAADNVDFVGVVKRANNVDVGTVFLVHRSQKRHHRELAALVDADVDRFFARNVKFDPTPALRNNTAAEALAVEFRFGEEVDARAAVQLANDDAFGAVNNKFAAAEHNRQFAKVDVVFNRVLFADEAKANAQRTTVGQAQTTAFVRRVMRFFKFVMNVFQTRRFFVIFDRERFAKNAFQTLVFTFGRRNVRLEEVRVAASLQNRQLRNRIGRAVIAELPSFFKL